MRNRKEMRVNMMSSLSLCALLLCLCLIFGRFRTNPQNEMEAIIYDNPIETVASAATLASYSFNNQQQTTTRVQPDTVFAVLLSRKYSQMHM